MTFLKGQERAVTFVIANLSEEDARFITEFCELFTDPKNAERLKDLKNKDTVISYGKAGAAWTAFRWTKN